MSELNNSVFPFPGMDDSEELDVASIFGGGGPASDVNPFDLPAAQTEQPAAPQEQPQAESPAASETPIVTPEPAAAPAPQPKPEKLPVPQAKTQNPAPAAEPANPISAAIDKQETQAVQTAAKSLFEKLPIFSYGSAKDEITDGATNDDFGVSPELSSFSLPLGATINMNGGCIYYAAAIVMTAQIYGMELTPAALVNIVISTVLVAMGCPGVPGGAIIMTTILLTNMGLPLEIVGMIAGIFRLIDMANTTFNVTGDVVTTMVVARSEKMIEPPVAVARK